MDSMEKHYSACEVSGFLGWSEDTIYRLVERGELKAVILPQKSPHRRRTYRSMRIPMSEIERFIRRNQK
jgi:predicted DNA-binding transcriptional regulator AlpA